MEDSIHPGTLAAILVGAFSVAGVFAWVLFKAVRALLKRSKVYRETTAAVAQDKALAELLGDPLEFGNAGGSIWWTMGFGRAHLMIPVTGSRGSGLLSVRASCLVLTWTYTSLNIAVGTRVHDLNRMLGEIGK